MDAGIALAVFGLIAALAGAWWLRRSSLEAGDSGALLGLVFCFVGLMFILVAVFGRAGS